MTVHRSVVVHPDHLSPIPSMFPSVKTQENREQELDDSVPADGGDIQMEQPSDGCTAQITLILRRSRMGTVWFYTSTSNKRAA